MLQDFVDTWVPGAGPAQRFQKGTESQPPPPRPPPPPAPLQNVVGPAGSVPTKKPWCLLSDKLLLGLRLPFVGPIIRFAENPPTPKRLPALLLSRRASRVCACETRNERRKLKTTPAPPEGGGDCNPQTNSPKSLGGGACVFGEVQRYKGIIYIYIYIYVHRHMYICV